MHSACLEQKASSMKLDIHLRCAKTRMNILFRIAKSFAMQILRLVREVQWNNYSYSKYLHRALVVTVQSNCYCLDLCRRLGMKKTKK